MRVWGRGCPPAITPAWTTRPDAPCLVLEDLGDVEQGDCLVQLAADPATRLARALAALHSSWWGRDELDTADWLPRSPWLNLDRDWFGPRRADFLERFGDRLDEPARRLLNGLESFYAREVAPLAAAPATLLHDDVHLDNVVVDRSTGEPILLDWARAATGPAALDLAELLVAIAAPGGTDKVLSVYRDALREGGVPDDDLAALERGVAAAVIVCFTKWTCGVARWMPASPREAQMIDLSIERAQRGLEEWRHRQPELFRSS